ncbi:hypothetical protein [Allomuricauda sp. R78024]|uniref:hypothetical protein n=1 Tax=Allomuricauda sp. R78024 TaxID=3093867 RepID=UPI0037C5AFA1
MFRLLSKIIIYLVLIFLFLEILVRVFHLHNDMPTRFVDNDNVNKWMPGQHGYSVHGNRRQNYAEFHINKAGYNSHRDFQPSIDGFEIAIIGDSFIEGFHQDYKQSLGKKVEDHIEGIQVYEYGHSATDLADHLFKIHNNQDSFDLIDHIIIDIKFEDDLLRNEYHRAKFSKPFFPFLKYSKLATYILNIGFLDKIKDVNRNVRSMFVKKKRVSEKEAPSVYEIDSLYMSNFKKLISEYGFNKKKTTFLLDSRVTSKVFIDYLDQHKLRYIDYGIAFKNAKEPVTLIYDAHWNNLGRTLIAEEIVEFLRKEKLLNN